MSRCGCPDLAGRRRTAEAEVCAWFPTKSRSAPAGIDMFLCTPQRWRSAAGVGRIAVSDLPRSGARSAAQGASPGLQARTTSAPKERIFDLTKESIARTPRHGVASLVSFALSGLDRYGFHPGLRPWATFLPPLRAYRHMQDYASSCRRHFGQTRHHRAGAMRGRGSCGVIEVVPLEGGTFSAQLVPQIAALRRSRLP